MSHPSTKKSGQAIIFLMMVVLIGLLVVIWNFDLHRVITAKIRVRNATDAAALAAARWQGITLNMIGDLNLIQAAILSNEAESQAGLPTFQVPSEIRELHELRARLAFIGPLAAYSIAQQTAFENGAFHDPALAEDVRFLAEEIREQEGYQPYDNAFDDYAELLELLADNGVAVGAFTPRIPAHPLTQEKFYGAIAQALAGWWCPMHDYEYELENYDGIDSWTKLDTEFDYNYVFDLKLDEFTSVAANADIGSRPSVTSFETPDEFETALSNYLAITEETGIVPTFGQPDYAYVGMYPREPDADITWHVYNGSWARRWPKPTYYDEETDEEGGQFPLRSAVRPEYNYIGAVAGLSMSTPVGRGILSTTDNETVDLVYKAKAMPFGSLESNGGTETPYYLGIVFPSFEDVRLIHSDIGGRVLSAAFYRHMVEHLAAYLEGGPEASDPDCRYCKLLRKWETLDRETGLEWLEQAYEDDDNNPCEPDDDEDRSWGKTGGGSTGGS
jgi:hypothetical protein